MVKNITVAAIVATILTGCGVDYETNPDRQELIDKMDSYFVSSNTYGTWTESIKPLETLSWETEDVNSTIRQYDTLTTYTVFRYNYDTNEVYGYALEDLSLRGYTSEQVERYSEDLMFATYTDGDYEFSFVGERNVGIIRLSIKDIPKDLVLYQKTFQY